LSGLLRSARNDGPMAPVSMDGGNVNLPIPWHVLHASFAAQ
jgi:hypothetical protein